MIAIISLSIAIVSIILLILVLLLKKRGDGGYSTEKVDIIPKGKDKKMVVIAVILFILLSVVATSVIIYEEVRYKSVQQKYEQLTDTHSSLMIEHDSLSDDYNTLDDRCIILTDQYNDLNETTQQYRQLPIDHLMAATYTKIREQGQPKYYYQRPPSEYAAFVCAHDLGRCYWPGIEDEYYDVTGSRLSHDAYSKITKVIDIIDISELDSNVDKIEKILKFIHTNIEYQYDLNNEFLFPVETITFRSGDCDDFTILAATLFEKVGIESAIGSFKNENVGHYMVLVNLPDLGDYECWFYDDLTTYGLSDGKWIILEPQSIIENQHEEDWIQKWDLTTAYEIPNQL